MAITAAALRASRRPGASGCVAKDIANRKARNEGCVPKPASTKTQEGATMPLVRISLNQSTDPAYAGAIGDAVHRALVESMNVPSDDKFQIISGGPAQIVYPPEYLGIRHSDAIVIIQITLNAGRTVEQKRALYAQIGDLLGVAPGVPRADIIINLVEVVKENWSFGDGIAQYAT